MNRIFSFMQKNLAKVLPALIAFVMSAPASSFGAAQCPNPKQDYPSISFGMTGIGAAYCKNQLDRARWLGFTAVSLSPTFFFNPDDSTVDAGFVAQDLTACLSYAKDLGFDIIYKPMIEAKPGTHPENKSTNKGPTTLEQNLMQTPNQTNAPWRAKFNFRPGDDYQKKALEPFLVWLETNHTRNTALNVSIVIATELHRSLVDHGSDWVTLIANLRQRLNSDGLADQVQIGLDPTIFGEDSWLADELKRQLSDDECNAYEQALNSVDFYSPSEYGNFISAGFNKDAPGSVQKIYDTSEKDWQRCLTSRGCSTNKKFSARFNDVMWPGELGYAGNLSATWSGFKTLPPYNAGAAAMQTYAQTTLVTEQQEFITEAPEWVDAVLTNARGSGLNLLSFWITGRFDLFGFSSLPPLGELDSYDGEYTSVDPVKGADTVPAVAKLRDLMQAYTSERCPGWQPALPVPIVTPAPVSTNTSLPSIL
jgi:hypothetical protein